MPAQAVCFPPNHSGKESVWLRQGKENKCQTSGRSAQLAREEGYQNQCTLHCLIQWTVDLWFCPYGIHLPHRNKILHLVFIGLVIAADPDTLRHGVANIASKHVSKQVNPKTQKSMHVSSVRVCTNFKLTPLMPYWWATYSGCSFPMQA